jgi:SAM-dependent methyltransferase
LRTDQFELHDRIERDHWWFVARRQILSQAIGACVPEGARVLDIGCGTGANIAVLGSRYDCVGIDTSEAALSYARAAYPHIRFVRASHPDQTPDLRGDAFLLSDVLEHIDDDIGFLESWCSLLSPGGHIFITVPASDVAWSPHDTNHGHRRRYTPERLRKVWENLDVVELTLTHFNTRLLPLVRWLRAFTAWRGSTVGEADTDLWVPPLPLNGILQRIFAGESPRLLRSMDRPGAPPAFRTGVSLFAALHIPKPAQ